MKKEKTTNRYQNDFEHFFHEEMQYKILADKEQYEYVTAILAPTAQVQAVFCDSPAGTGKTSIAMAAAYYRLLKNKESTSRIIYVRNTLAVRENGFLPGTAEEKELQFMKPAIENINRIGQSLNTHQDLFADMLAKDEIEVCSTSYLRGVDIEGDATLIIDEAQNLDTTELQTVLTRIHDSVKVVIIGSSLQCDNTKLRTYGPDKLTPFELYMAHFKKQSIIPVAFANLKTNHRGKFSNYADTILDTIKEQNAAKDLHNASKPNNNTLHSKPQAHSWQGAYRLGGTMPLTADTASDRLGWPGRETTLDANSINAENVQWVEGTSGTHYSSDLKTELDGITVIPAR